MNCATYPSGVSISQWNKFKHAAAPTWSYDLDGHLSLSSTLRVNVEVGIVLDTHAAGLDATTSSVACLGVGCCHSKKQWTMTHEQWDSDVLLVCSELLHLFTEKSFHKPEISTTNYIFFKQCVKTTYKFSDFQSNLIIWSLWFNTDDSTIILIMLMTTQMTFMHSKINDKKLHM